MIRPASDYGGEQRVQGLAYTDPDGRVIIRFPWYGPTEELTPPSRPTGLDWGYDPSFTPEGAVTFLHKLVMVCPEVGVMEYFLAEKTLRQVPGVEAKEGTQAFYSPSGEFVVVAQPEDASFYLTMFRSGSGTVYREVEQGVTSWAWSPSSEPLAVAVPRNLTFGSTSDLAIFDWTTGSLWTLVQGNGGHSWEPRFWGSYTDLAYSDSRDGSRLYWIDVQTGRTPSEDPGVPLAGDPNRIASLIPAGLAPSWTGQYAVSADEELAAIVCQSTDLPPTIFVCEVSQGEWYVVGPGDGPVWTDYPKRPWGN